MAAKNPSASKTGARLGKLPAATQPHDYGLQKLQLEAMLKTMVRLHDEVSDLFFICDRPPHVEIDGVLHPVQTDPPGAGLSADHIEEMFLVMTNDNPRLRTEYLAHGSCDFSYSIRNARFRINYFRRNGLPAMVMRKLQPDVPTMSSLGLPEIFSQAVQEKNGLVLVTGGTGHGKTTTLAAMMNEINETLAVHAITLEDPIEFLHPIKKSIISQRELGKDFNDFPTALRAALRQAPKVILIGEIRDRSTIEIAMTAAETGHLVFASIHTIDAGQTISRILGMFESSEESLVRQRLAETLRWVISQRLVARIGGGRHLIAEVMGNNLSTREAILSGEKEDRTFTDIIASSQTRGWQTFHHQILAAFRDGIIDEETALLYSNQKMRLSKEFDDLRKEKEFAGNGKSRSGLRLDEETHR